MNRGDTLQLKTKGYACLLLMVVLVLAGCGAPPAVLPTQAAVAVLATAVPTQPAIATNAAAPPPTAAPENTAVAEAESAGERPLLPRFSRNTNTDTGSQPTGLNAAAPGPDAFAQAAFTLNTPLPADPTSATVLRAVGLPFNSQQAQNLAARFGFDGPVYSEVLPDVLQSPAGLPADAAAPPELTPAFFAFDGPRTLNIGPQIATYTDSRVPVDYQNPAAFAQAAPIAEAFLQAQGLLDFPYALQEGWGQEVFVVRVIDGRPASQPEISVGVGGGGQVAYASYQMAGAPVPVGSYPLIPAETAWQQLQAGVDASIMTAITPRNVGPATEPDGGFQYWPRQHQSGPDVHLYAWPAAYLPADGTGAPRIQMLGYTLQADEGTLAALAEQVGQNVHVWGSLDTAVNTLTVAGWEPLPELNPLFKNGVLQRVDGQARLQDAQTGETFILPDVPADVPDGAAVNVFAWAVREAGQPFPVLDWEGIDRQLSDEAGAAGAVALEGAGETAVPAYQQITINQVELAYYRQTMGGEASPEVLWQPAWVFHATADNGDVLTFTIQAVDPAFRQP